MYPFLEKTVQEFRNSNKIAFGDTTGTKYLFNINSSESKENWIEVENELHSLADEYEQ